MLTSRLLPGLVLIAVISVACAPVAAQTQTAAQPVVIQPTATFPPSIPTLDQSVQPTVGPTQDTAPTPFPIATSRGPNLEATDPGTVNMASGGLQFVEFFEFW